MRKLVCKTSLGSSCTAKTNKLLQIIITSKSANQLNQWNNIKLPPTRLSSFLSSGFSVRVRVWVISCLGLTAC